MSARTDTPPRGTLCTHAGWVGFAPVLTDADQQRIFPRYPELEWWLRANVILAELFAHLMGDEEVTLVVSRARPLEIPRYITHGEIE